MGDSSLRRHGLHTGPFARRAKVPWKECNHMDERLKFIAGLLDGEKMAVLCRQFGISRKTGYKIFARYNDCGLEGLTDRSRRPYRHANQLPFQIETWIVRLKQDKPSWGAPKIREKLARLYPDVHTPAISTVHAILDRHGLVKRRMGRRNRAKGTALSLPGQPNDLWCADYKGEFMLADRRYCYPLTITDFASRYLFACEASSLRWIVAPTVWRSSLRLSAPFPLSSGTRFHHSTCDALSRRAVVPVRRWLFSAPDAWQCSSPMPSATTISARGSA